MTRRGVISGALLSAATADAQQGLASTGTASVTMRPPLVGPGEVAHVVCDKCGSDDIKYHQKHPPKPKDVKLSEWVNRPSVTVEFAIYTTTAMVAECRKCKFAVEYQQ